MHGHHYEIEIVLEGHINTQEGESDQGMLIDFSHIKEITNQYIINPWDHAFFVYKNDNEVLEFLNSLDNHKTVVTDQPPTAEYLAHLAYQILSKKLNDQFQDQVYLNSLKLFETYAETIFENYLITIFRSLFQNTFESYLKTM